MREIPRGRILFARYKTILEIITLFYKLLPLRMRKRALERYRNIRGKLGLGLRYAILKSITESIGENIAIFPGVFILNPENIVIGNNVSIHPMSYIECGYQCGGVTIGNDVSIAHGVTIMGTTHRFESHESKIKDQGIANKAVNIMDNVWIGAKAVILSGVTVGSGCVIGASAVVTKSTNSNGIYVGVPARCVKER